MQTEVTSLIEESGRISGIRGSAPAGPIEVRAELVVGADGRNSRVRDCASLPVENVGASMDSLQIRLPRRADDPDVFVYSDRGKTMVTINRGDYWHCGFAVPKGAAAEMQSRGIEALRASIAEVAPFLRDRLTELRGWGEVRLLTVRADRLRQWYRPGLLCIGDAAHAMSPVGGVGINLAIQDAVAAANILAGPLRESAVTIKDLEKVQRRRILPTRVTQRMQGVIQRQIWRGLGKVEPTRPSLLMRLAERTTLPCRMRTRLIAVGVRPEHVRTPDAYK